MEHFTAQRNGYQCFEGTQRYKYIVINTRQLNSIPKARKNLAVLCHRYCSDFNLCAECEGKPREGIHEKTHLFIKLRKPAEKQPPKRPVLHDVGFSSNIFIGVL